MTKVKNQPKLDLLALFSRVLEYKGPTSLSGTRKLRIANNRLALLARRRREIFGIS